MLNHSKTFDDTTLHITPALSRAHRHLRDLIIVACESYTNTPSRYLSLTRLEYVSDEKLDGKFSMHLKGLVREQDRADAIPLNLTITVEVPE